MVKIKKFLIAGGNSTALVWDCPNEKRKEVTRKLLNDVEQVGFVLQDTKIPKLNMAGDELCINATLAFAFQLSGKGVLFTSGIKEKVEFDNENKETLIKIPLKYHIEDNLVLFERIGFIFFENQRITKEFLSNLAEKYKLPAFGAIIYKKNKIVPYVYVKEVNSFVKETACGSGSIAFAILKGVKTIIQPTGEIISVKIIDDSIKIKAKVREIK
jgi:hypothetical protein